MNFTSKFTVILTEFPALTTMKLFILLFMNFGLTKLNKTKFVLLFFGNFNKKHAEPHENVHSKAFNKTTIIFQHFVQMPQLCHFL